MARRALARIAPMTNFAAVVDDTTIEELKVIHDVLNDEDGVQSRSEGEDPQRRIVVDVA